MEQREGVETTLGMKEVGLIGSRWGLEGGFGGWEGGENWSSVRTSFENKNICRIFSQQTPIAARIYNYIILDHITNHLSKVLQHLKV